MGHSYTSLYYHIVYSTKQRRALLRPEHHERLIRYTGGIMRSNRCSLIAANTQPEHVHFLVHAHPSKSLADLLRDIKSRTTGWARETWPEAPFGWQTGYGAFTVSKSAVDDVTRYIADQEEHHRRMTFQEEFVALLERHGIEYDPKYLWTD